MFKVTAAVAVFPALSTAVPVMTCPAPSVVTVTGDGHRADAGEGVAAGKRYGNRRPVPAIRIRLRAYRRRNRRRRLVDADDLRGRRRVAGIINGRPAHRLSSAFCC